MNIPISLSEEHKVASVNHAQIGILGFFSRIRDRVYNGDSANPMYEYPPSGFSKVVLHTTFMGDEPSTNVYEQLQGYAFAHFPHMDARTIQQGHVIGCLRHGTQPAISFVTTDGDILSTPSVQENNLHNGHGTFKTPNKEGKIEDELNQKAQLYIDEQYPGP